MLQGSATGCRRGFPTMKMEPDEIIEYWMKENERLRKALKAIVKVVDLDCNEDFYYLENQLSKVVSLAKKAIGE
jgi:hypothetical protein